MEIWQPRPPKRRLMRQLHQQQLERDRARVSGAQEGEDTVAGRQMSGGSDGAPQRGHETKGQESKSDEISFDDFMKVDIRVGTIVEAEDFPEARKPAYKLKIDFGPDIGIKKSSAQITANYSRQELIGRQVCAVVNFPPRQIGPIMSQVLTLGMPDEEGEVMLIAPDRCVPNGGRLY